MGDYTVIGDVTSVIVGTLHAAMQELQPPGQAIADDLSGTSPTSPPTLTVFLYEICEDATSRNRPPVRPDPADPFTVRKPPMALLLRYLITAWGGDQITQHRMLGRALQIFYDDAILDGLRLSGSLAATTDALHVALTKLTLEQQSYVWYAIQKPYRLSLNYEIRVVNLDSTADIAEQPVRARELRFTRPDTTVVARP